MESLPKDAKACSILLTNSGISSCEPKVISALQEYIFRTTGKVLKDASAMADYCGRSEIVSQDLKTVMQLSAEGSELSFQELLHRADEINSRPFPELASQIGVPRDEDCLLSVNFKITSLSGH